MVPGKLSTDAERSMSEEFDNQLSGKRHSVFVSYSRQDEGLVEPLVRLLRGTKDYVFFDKDSMVPGRQWRAQIRAAIQQVQLVVVFWCEHSSSSKEVASEITIATSLEKDILPLILDATPLSETLSQYHSVDFRSARGNAHDTRGISDGQTPISKQPYLAVEVRKREDPTGKTSSACIYDGGTIGRAKSNTLVLEDPTISKHHLLVEIGESGAAIVELGSTNGTAVKTDGRLVSVASRRELIPGDQLILGEYEIGIDLSNIANPTGSVESWSSATVLAPSTLDLRLRLPKEIKAIFDKQAAS